MAGYKQTFVIEIFFKKIILIELIITQFDNNKVAKKCTDKTRLSLMDDNNNL